MTIKNTIIGACLISIPLTISISIPVCAASSVYKVDKVKVDATAKNAVIAKKKALKQGPALALNILLHRLTHYNSYHKLPKFSDAIAEDFTDNSSILKEKNSSIRYLALLNYQFQAKRIRRFLLSKNIPLYDRQMSRTTIIPVYKAGPYRKDKRLWPDAWRPLDLKNTLTPVQLARPPVENDPVIERLLSGNHSALQSLYSKYNTNQLVVAFAQPDAEGKYLNFHLVGKDEVGGINIKRQFLIFNDNVQIVTEMAAKITLGILEGRWKEAKMLDIPLANKADAQQVSIQSGSAPARSLARQPLFMTIPFNSLRGWQTIRKRLNDFPGMEDMTVKSLSARSAFVYVAFPGGEERLSRMVSRYGMRLERQNDTLYLHSR